MRDEIQLELGKYALKILDYTEYTLGYSIVVHVTADGELWKSLLLDTLWDGKDGFYGMALAMHSDLYYLAPETTQIVIVDPGDNIGKITYLLFAFGGGG